MSILVSVYSHKHRVDYTLQYITWYKPKLPNGPFSHSRSHIIIAVCLLRGSEVLRKDNVWNTSSASDCKPTQGGGALFFYTQPATSSGSVANHPAAVISSRQLVIGPLDPRNVTLEPRPPVTTTLAPSTQSASEAESEVLEIIGNDQRISGILTLVKMLFLWVCIIYVYIT